MKANSDAKDLRLLSPPSRKTLVVRFATNLALIQFRGVMIPGSESIQEPELHHFSEIDDSDSDSKNIWNHNTYWGVEVPGLESIPESEPFIGLIPIPIPRRITES